MSRHSETRGSTVPHLANRIRETLLTVGAIGGVLALGLFAAGIIFGITPLVFTSGSMAPTIETGALAFARTVPADEIRSGDVVSVLTDGGTRITHRVESITVAADGQAVAILRGDANPVADSTPYAFGEADRILFSVNKLGYIASWLSGPSGLVLGILAAGGLLYIAFHPRRPGSPSDSDGPSNDVTGARSATDPTSKSPGSFLTISTLGAVGIVSFGALSAGGTTALFADAATASSIAFSAPATVPTSPSTLGCTSSTNATLTWTAVAGQSYRIIFKNVATGATLPNSMDVAAGQVTLTPIDLPSGGLLLGSTQYSVEVHGLSGDVVTTSYAAFKITSTTTVILFSSLTCNGSSTFVNASSPKALAAPAPAVTDPTSTTTTSTTAPTSSPATPNTATSSTAVISTTTSTPSTTTAPPTTTTTATTTTTVPPITTTPSEVPIGAPATTNGLSAQKLSTASGTVVSVSNSSGTEVYRGTVDADAVLHWLTGTDQLYVITTGGVTVIDTSAGVWAESPAPSELPDEIKALVP